MLDDIPTADELRSLIVTILVGATDRDPAQWERVVGGVTVHPTWNHIFCNWTVEGVGSTSDRFAIAKAAEIVRGEHPYAQK